jgi:hypothetical protein
MSTRVSGREKWSDRAADRPVKEADRRFALLVALMAPDERRRECSRRDGSDPQDRPMAIDPPADDEGEGERRRLPWQNLTILLFVVCLIAAILFIVAASFIKP